MKIFLFALIVSVFVVGSKYLAAILTETLNLF